MRRRLNSIALVIAILAVGVIFYRFATGGVPISTPITVAGDDRERPVTAALADFDPGEIVNVTGKDSIPAIHDPQIVPGDEARLREEEFVIGIELAGEARAYPIRVLSAHEIVNDEIAGQPFAVTW